MKMTILTLISCFVFASLTAPPAPSAVIFDAEGVNPFLKVWNASGIVESGKNPHAYHATDQKAGSWGIVQIGKPMLNAYNRDNGTNSVPRDCFDVSISRKVFMWHFQKYYPNIEAGCRSWNGGNNWKHKKSTINYWKKIQKHL